MANSINNEIKDKASIYLSLSKSLEQERDPWVEREIEKIVSSSSSLSIEQKIYKIKQLEKLIIAFSKGENTKEQKTKIRKKKEVNKKHRNKKYIPFYGHYRIKRFGQETSTLILKYFPPRFELKLIAIEKSLKRIQTLITHLRKATSYIVNNGFLLLSKEEYNIVYELYRFINEYSISFFKSYESKNLVLLQKRFIKIIQNIYYKKLIQTAFRKALRNSIYYSDMELILGYIRQIILSSLMKPSLAHIFMAMQMKHTKRFISIKEFIYKNNPQTISKSYFIANNKILERIEYYKQSLKDDIYIKEKQLNYLSFINNNIEANLQKPKLFYIKELFSHHLLEKGLPYKETYNFRKALSNIVEFSLLILEEYLYVFDDLALKKTTLITKDGREVSERLFPYRLEKNFVEIKETYRLINDMLQRKLISDASFLDYKDYLEVPKENSNKLFPILQNLSDNFYKVSTKLYENYSLEEELKNMSYEEKLRFANDGSILEKAIPYKDEYINLNYFLKGKTVKESYLALIGFAVNFAVLYGSKELIGNLASKGELDRKLSLLKVSLERIS